MIDIDAHGFIKWAKRIDGPADKVYTQLNSGQWITCHSVVGEEGENADGIPNRFLSEERLPNGQYTASAAASSMFVLRKNGLLIQMYPVWASTWTSGGREANCASWAIEAEGGQEPNTSELLTPAAEATFGKLVKEWEAYSGKKAVAGVTLRQHKDVAAQYGYAATACASDRYARAWERISREDELSAQQLEELKALQMRRQLAALAADLARYQEMKAVYAFAEANGYLRP